MGSLTEIAVRNLKAPERGQVTLTDDGLPGFGLRVSQGGTKSFVLVRGKTRERVTIGRYPVISLAGARSEAKRILAERTLGRARPKSIAWDEAKTLFLAACAQKNKSRTLDDYTRLLKRHFAFGKTLLADITTQQITHRLDRLVDTPSEQNHALVAIKVFLRWAVRRRYIGNSPCEGLFPSKRPPRERTLADKELASVFKTALKGTDAFSNIVALLVLTGQRRGEIAALQWSWIDTKERTITLPSSATKNKRAHTFPYGKRTAGILKRVRRASETYVFPASRDKVKGKPATIFNGWGKPKGAFDRESGVTDWQLHDIRRTFASNLAALGVPLPTIEKLLNHVSGSFGGIVSVYQRHNCLPEMRDAMRKWEARLGELVR
jgi:integrase